MPQPVVAPVDALDLPEWLGVEAITWTAVTSLDSGATVTGSLHGPAGEETGCDMLACDRAYPQPVLEEKWRSAAHQAWQHGETQLLELDGRLTLVVPGSVVEVQDALEAVRRLAKAVGSTSDKFTVALRL